MKVQNDSGVTQIIHTYGASNHRLIEQVENESSNQRTYYGWAGDSVIAEYEETAAAPTTPRWVKSYVYLGGRLLATIAPNGGSERVEYQHPDRLGTRLVTNNQDTTSFEQVVLPFGRALDAESSGSTKRRFTSYDRSIVTGLDYAVNRHYDALQGRFTQVDPIGMASASLANPQTLNLYAYCANDPINRTDPSGLGFFSFLGKIFGAIGKALHFVAKVLAVVAVVAAVVFLAWGMPYVALAFGIFSGLLFASAYGPPIVGKLLLAAGGVARGVTVAGTPPINPSAGGGIGPISSFLAQNPELPVRRIGLADLLRLMILPDVLAAARTALQRERCRSLFGAGVDPIELLDTLARGNTTRGSISLGNLGARQGGNVTAAQTTGVLGVRTVVRVGHVGPEFIRQSAFFGANVVINSNRAAPFQAGYRRRFGVSDAVNRAVTVIHELGHAAAIIYGPDASMILDDQNNAGQSRANSQRVYNDCFR